MIDYFLAQINEALTNRTHNHALLLTSPCVGIVLTRKLNCACQNKINILGDIIIFIFSYLQLIYIGIIYYTINVRIT